MLRAGALGIGLAALLGGTARAGAWPLEPGSTQAILKYEPSSADDGYDPGGRQVPLAGKLREDRLSLFVEHGITSRLTFQGEASYEAGEDQFLKYDGRGPIALGLRYTALRTSRSVVSLYVGGIVAGEGRNAGYALPHQGDGDAEVRLLAGHSFKIRGRDLFGEVQAARLFRSGLPDETRIDATLGLYVTRRWLVLVQSYAGQADVDPVSPQWVKVDLTVVRHLGPWSLQAGWRQSVYGRESPVEGGPVIAVWRRF